MDSSFSKMIFNHHMKHILSKNRITSFEQIREAFIAQKDKMLGFLRKNKKKIEFLFEYLNKKRIETQKQTQTELGVLCTS